MSRPILTVSPQMPLLWESSRAAGYPLTITVLHSALHRKVQKLAARWKPCSISYPWMSAKSSPCRVCPGIHWVRGDFAWGSIASKSSGLASRNPENHAHRVMVPETRPRSRQSPYVLSPNYHPIASSTISGSYNSSSFGWRRDNRVGSDGPRFPLGSNWQGAGFAWESQFARHREGLVFLYGEPPLSTSRCGAPCSGLGPARGCGPPNPGARPPIWSAGA